MLGIAIIFLLAFILPKHGTITYDCRMSDISPDFPPEVRNECRKLRAQPRNNNE
jgi:hypothetical protein